MAIYANKLLTLFVFDNAAVAVLDVMLVLFMVIVDASQQCILAEYPMAHILIVPIAIVGDHPSILAFVRRM